MTTIHTPAASCAGDTHRRVHTYRRIQTAAPRVKYAALIAALASAGLAGCESSSALFGSNQSTPETQLSQSAAPVQAAPVTPQTRVAVAPVIGAPDAVGRQLQQEFGSAVAKQRATVVAAGDKADFTLRGYVVAAKDRAGTKVSYIWDVTDPAGKRVNRITGEEILASAAGKDPWSSVTPAVMQTIAQKSASSFGSWLPSATSQAAVATAPAATQPIGVGAPNAVATASTAPLAAAARPPQAAPTPVAYQPNDVTAVVPSVTGAPGDGSMSLTQALQNELSKNGVALANQASASSYRVEGVVKVGQIRDGKQPIQIDWNVRDPQGKRLGTVSQKNEIPEGSLDGPWGKTADAAAAAAAQGILKLLPQRSNAN